MRRPRVWFLLLRTTACHWNSKSEMSSLLQRVWRALVSAGSREKASLQASLRAGAQNQKRQLNQREVQVMRAAVKKFEGGEVEG